MSETSPTGAPTSAQKLQISSGAMREARALVESLAILTDAMRQRPFDIVEFGDVHTLATLMHDLARLVEQMADEQLQLALRRVHP